MMQVPLFSQRIWVGWGRVLLFCFFTLFFTPSIQQEVSVAPVTGILPNRWMVGETQYFPQQDS
jgi:hypothetical protein